MHRCCGLYVHDRHCIQNFVEMLVFAYVGAMLFICYQDVLVLNCSSDFYHKTKVLAMARMALKQQGVVGLSQAPCLRALFNNLPVIIQQQHTCEKVSTSFCFYHPDSIIFENFLCNQLLTLTKFLTVI